MAHSLSRSLADTRRIWLPPLTLMLLMLLVELLGDSGRQWLSFDRAQIEAGQWWRFLSGNLAHLGWYHWFLNELGLVVLILLCPQALPWRVWLRRLLWLSLGMTLCLYLFVPDMHNYVGMSGVIHGLFVLGLMPQVLKRDLIAIGCLAYLLGKIGWELYAGAAVSDEVAIGGRVATESHFFGVVAAFAYGLVFRSFTGREALVPAAVSPPKNDQHPRQAP
jgi:rhomboid family GlyGly-CTERM serine protease